MTSETFGNAEFRTFCEEQATVLIDLFMAEGRQRGTPERERVQGLIAFAAELDREARAILRQIERTGR